MNDLSPAPGQPQILPAFNYGALEPSLAIEAKAIATRIKMRLRASFIATGQDLVMMKEKLGHGRFGTWLDAEFGMSARTAERYMGAARIAAANSDIMADLPPMVVDALAAPSLPEAARAACMERIRAGVVMSPKDIAQQGSAIRYAAKERKMAERSLPRSKKARADAVADLDAADRRREAEAVKVDRARQDILELVADALGERRSEAVRLLRSLSRYSLNAEDLLAAINRQEGGA